MRLGIVTRTGSDLKARKKMCVAKKWAFNLLEAGTG